MMTLDDIKICVMDLGYVGLLLARLFSTKFPTIGFDVKGILPRDIIDSRQ